MKEVFFCHSGKIIKYSSIYIFRTNNKRKIILKRRKQILEMSSRHKNEFPFRSCAFIYCIYTNDNNPKMWYTMWILNFHFKKLSKNKQRFFSFDVENCTPPSCLSIFLYWICYNTFWRHKLRNLEANKNFIQFPATQTKLSQNMVEFQLPNPQLC